MKEAKQNKKQSLLAKPQSKKKIVYYFDGQNVAIKNGQKKNIMRVLAKSKSRKKYLSIILIGKMVPKKIVKKTF